LAGDDGGPPQGWLETACHAANQFVTTGFRGTGAGPAGSHSRILRA